MRLIIEKIVAGGFGLARTDQGTVFCENVLPHEIITVDGLYKKAGTLWPRTQVINEPSEFRTKPVCPLFGICGGCDFQHISYPYQVQVKQQIVTDCLLRIGKIQKIPQMEIIHSPQWNYRIRAQIKLDFEKNCVGFFQKKTHDVIKVSACPLCDPALNELFFKNQEHILRCVDRHVHQIKVLASESGTCVSEPCIEQVSHTFIDRRVGAVQYRIKGSDFFQNNKYLLECFGAWAHTLLSGKVLVDLFGGIGFFALQCAPRFGKVFVVDSQKNHSNRVNENCALNGITNVLALPLSAEQFMAKSIDGKEPFDCLIVDPPRGGLTKEIIAAIAVLKPRTILSIACDPATHARDIGLIQAKCGYSIERFALFDLYPHTHHIETAVLLKTVT